MKTNKHLYMSGKELPAARKLKYQPSLFDNLFETFAPYTLYALVIIATALLIIDAVNGYLDTTLAALFK